MSETYVARVDEKEAGAIYRGDKRYLIYQGGYYIQRGDRVKFIVYAEGLSRVLTSHPLNDTYARVKFVSTEPGIEKGYAALSIELEEA